MNMFKQNNEDRKAPNLKNLEGNRLNSENGLVWEIYKPLLISRRHSGVLNPFQPNFLLL